MRPPEKDAPECQIEGKLKIFFSDMAHLLEQKNKIGTYVYPKKRVELLQNGYSEASVT